MLDVEARLTRLPRHAVVSGVTAAWLLGVDVSPGPPLDVTFPGSDVSARAGFRIRHGVLDHREIATARGFRITSPTRTIADLSRTLPVTEAVVVADQMLQTGAVTPSELSTAVDWMRGWKGIRKFRRVVELSDPGAESPMETRLRLLLVLSGLPRPQTQVQLGGARVDLYYAEARLVIEYDGDIHRTALVSDTRRQNRLLAGGYRLLRFTAPDMRNRPDDVVAAVRAGLSGAGTPW